MGRLARSLAPELEAAGHRVSPWHRGQPIPHADLHWITATDSAVAEVARLVPQGGVLLHASGLLDLQVLRPHSPAGSLHPLQTFPGPEVAVPELLGVPAAVAGDPLAVEAASSLARSIGLRPFPAPADRRLYHLSCVLAGNFVSVLLAEAGELLTLAGLRQQDPQSLLGPLVRAAVENALLEGPQALTGPVARGDCQTLAAHREALQQHAPERQALYEALVERAGRLVRQRGER